MRLVQRFLFLSGLVTLTAFGQWPMSNGLSPYRWEELPKANFANSSRIDNLLRAGNLYLSLQDAVALALENNLDIAYQRYAPLNARANLLRARSGGSVSNSTGGIQTGTTDALSQIAGLSGTGAESLSSSGTSSGASSGSTGLSFDPFVYLGGKVGHQTSPIVNSFTTGTSTEVDTSRNWQVGVQQAFATGTKVELDWGVTSVGTNALRSDFNPYTQAQMQLTITQNLLQGFGLAVNNRNIRIAKNSIAIADLQFKQQVTTTVYQVISAYWDLVSFYDNLAVKQQSLELSQQLYENTKKEVEIGTSPKISLVQARLEVASRTQQLATAQTSVRQQETALKTILSRTGVASPSLSSAHIIPTDRMPIPEPEKVEPIQDAVNAALTNRLEIRQNRISLENSNIALAGTKNALRPSLDVQASFVNNGLAGKSNADGSTIDPLFLGGFGTTWNQILSRKFPDYSIGFTLNVPLRNRAARADMIAAQIALRQQEISNQRLQNSIRADVLNAKVALADANDSYKASVEATNLAQELSDAEKKKYELGTSSLFNVVYYQRDLATARSTQVQALSGYAQARLKVDYVLGNILDRYNVSITDALKGPEATTSILP